MIELLAPAGSPEALNAAIAEGADAVYLGLKSFNARMRSLNFAYSQFEGALRSLHRMGRRLYVTVNTVFEQREADRVYQLLKYLAAVKPDGIIVQDFGIVLMAKEFPQLTIHASTQMNISCAQSANALSRHGISRVVLARELSLEEIKDIRQNTNVELEVFVHGALCVSASGLCLFSSYLGGKSANRGLCTQACRRIYRPIETENPKKEKFTSEKGYYFSPKDLSLINHIPKLAEAGVRALKIEGRMKSAEYVGTVVSAYRKVIDNLDSSPDKLNKAIDAAKILLNNDFARPKTEFYFLQQPDTYINPKQDGGTGISLGTIIKVRDKLALIYSNKIKLSPGDSLRFHKADDKHRITHKLTHAEKDQKDAYYISIPPGFSVGDSVYLVQTKSMSKSYTPIIPKDLKPYKRQPGREQAPKIPIELLESALASIKDQSLAPAGIYVQVASIEDLYIVQSIRPAAVIVPVNRHNIRALLEDRTLPFKAHNIILALDPWFPQEDSAIIMEMTEKLQDCGYHSYLLNNPGHFSLFRTKEPRLLIAGPWLYTFNTWALAFSAGLGAKAFVSPLENNRQNLEKTIPLFLRSKVFITIFSWPPLFRLKTGPALPYDFKYFTGNDDNEEFSLIQGDKNAVVIPNKPFCITDKVPFLHEASFRRYILDFSGGTYNGAFPLAKKQYKEIMTAAQEGRLCQKWAEISRFNWKDGFFSKKTASD